MAKGGWLFHMVLRVSDFHRRMLAMIFGILGPELAYRITGRLARALYRSWAPLRIRCESQCRAALGTQIAAADLSGLCEQSFVHRIWNLTDLMLAHRYLHATTFHQFGGRIAGPYRERLLQSQKNRQPVILVTAYYGPFDLLPLFLGYNGIRAGVVYRPHPNARFDAERQRIRGCSGCEMISVGSAMDRIPKILGDGGMVAILADHHATRHGLAGTFLGLPTRSLRTVGLLADHYGAGVVVAGIRRVQNRFKFEIQVSDVFGPDDWKTAADPVACITYRYLQGLERIILAEPSQYLWVHQRWGEDVVCRPTAGEQGKTEGHLAALSRLNDGPGQIDA